MLLLDKEISYIYKAVYVTFFVCSVASLGPVLYYIFRFKVHHPYIEDYPQWALDHYDFVRENDAGVTGFGWSE